MQILIDVLKTIVAALVGVIAAMIFNGWEHKQNTKKKPGVRKW